MSIDERRAAARAPTILRVLAATRPWSFSMTTLSVALGTLAAAGRQAFNPWLAIVTLAGALAAHGGTNLANDYVDFTDGLDTRDSPTARYRHHHLVEGTLLPRHVLAGAVSLFAAAALSGVYLSLQRGWVIPVLVTAGSLAAVFYSARPVRLKSRALGELTAFLMWGPCMTLGAFFVQTGSFSGGLPVLLVSVVQGAWVALVLFANNLKDFDFDQRKGVRTLANILGRKPALGFFVALLSATYVLVLVEVALRALSPWTLLVLASSPLAVRLAYSFLAAESIPANADPAVARAGMAFGSLLVIGLALQLIP